MRPKNIRIRIYNTVGKSSGTKPADLCGAATRIVLGGDLDLDWLVVLEQLGILLEEGGHQLRLLLTDQGAAGRVF